MNLEGTHPMDKIDEIHIDVPTFLRLLELAREDVEDDAELHFITQRVNEISQERTVTMADYEDILDFAMGNSKEQQLADVRRLSGL